MEIIRSKANKLIKETKKLRQKKYRKTSYLIEGWHLLEEAQKSGARLERVFVEETFLDRVQGADSVHLVTQEVLAELADSQTPQGVVAQVAIAEQSLPEKLVGKYLVIEDVQDPGNLGTMIRTADAAGYAGVFLSQQTVDIHNMKVLRSMQGSHFHLPIYRLPVTAILERLRQSQIRILASTLSSQSVDYKSVSASDSLALVVGNEGQGISSLVAEKADILVHIGMPGQAESLNVAVAAGILLFNFI